MEIAHRFRTRRLGLPPAPSALILFLLFPCTLFCLGVAGSARADESVWLSALDVGKTQQDWGKPRRDKSVEGHPITIAATGYAHGLGTHAASTLYVKLAGAGKRFTAAVGVDDEVRQAPAPIEFEVLGDGRSLFKSKPLTKGQPAEKVDADLSGVKTLMLLVRPSGDSVSFCHADWADAKIEYDATGGKKPATIDAPSEPAVILTPAPRPEPRVNGPKVFGVRPGHPFFYKIPATGDKPLRYAADSLPAGLTLDPQTGIITGKLADKGEYGVVLRASNEKGQTGKPFKIVVGDTIALTPPLGWNSWNCFAGAVDDAKVRAAADAMVNSGLIDHGWTYINIDDTWEIKPGSKDPLLSGPPRDAGGMINTNKKFPDMKALADYVHGKGLKIGLYSSPGPLTCAGFEASYKHEDQDAKRYAEWGFDYLKYDWCSYGNIARNPDLAAMKKPYEVMRASLNKADRDIVYSLCQYGMGDVWKWGAEVGGNCWRTTGDINDSWGSMSGIGFSQNGHEKFAGPGHWNDPDMLVVGKVGWGPHLRPTKLTPNEQYTHITLWSLLSSPLLIGCDMTQFDDFTRSLLTNDEVLDVNQDPLGRPAGRVAKEGSTEVWARDLEGGAKAVGLFNRGETEQKVTARWSDLGITGKHAVRDLWRQQDVGDADGEYSVTVPRHGAVLVKVSLVKG